MINIVIQSFAALAPSSNQCFCTMVVWCALNSHLSQHQHQQVSLWFLVHVTPHIMEEMGNQGGVEIRWGWVLWVGLVVGVQTGGLPRA